VSRGRHRSSVPGRPSSAVVALKAVRAAVLATWAGDVRGAGRVPRTRHGRLQRGCQGRPETIRVNAWSTGYPNASGVTQSDSDCRCRLATWLSLRLHTDCGEPLRFRSPFTARKHDSPRVVTSNVAHLGDTCAYGCAYRLVSVTCIWLQLVANAIPTRCSTFPCVSVRCSLLSRTFNPKVAGSSPARPTSHYATREDTKGGARPPDKARKGVCTPRIPRSLGRTSPRPSATSR
jgi:hypothetical protein